MKVQALKYLKIGTCPASQKVLAYMGKKLISLDPLPPLDPHIDRGKMFLLWIFEILQRKFFFYARPIKCLICVLKKAYF